MMIEAGAAINGIKVAMDMAKGIAALKTTTEINHAIIDIQQTLLEAQTAALSDKEKIADLSHQIAELQKILSARQNWENEKNRYRLSKTPYGSYCYELIAEKANGEPPHMLCEKCFHDGQKSILHHSKKSMGSQEMITCNRCNAVLTHSFSALPASTLDDYEDSWTKRR